MVTTKQIRSRRLPISCRDLQSRQRIENNQDYYCRRPEKVLLILSAHGGGAIPLVFTLHMMPKDCQGHTQSRTLSIRLVLMTLIYPQGHLT